MRESCTVKEVNTTKSGILGSCTDSELGCNDSLISLLICFHSFWI